MELIKRTIITPVSENLSPITISLQRNDIGEYMVVTNQKQGKETSIAYTSTEIIANEWYTEKINDNRTELIKMDMPFGSKEYAD
jgi:subtilase family serine protease